MTENTNEAQYRSSRQDILTAWQKDTPVKMLDNRQVLDNLEAYVGDKLNITKSLHDRLGLTESSLPETQSVTVAMVQSDQLTTNIPNNSPNNAEIGQQDDYDYQDDREEHLYQVDDTMDIHSPTDHSVDDEDTEPDNNTCKRQRKTYTPADTIRKDLTKRRQAQMLKNQQEKERAKAQAFKNRDKTDKTNRNKPKRPTAQPEDNLAIILMILTILEHISLKVKHLTLTKLRVPKRVKEHLEQVVMQECKMILHWTWTLKISITDEYNPKDDGEYAVGPDEIFWKDKAILLTLTA